MQTYELSDGTSSNAGARQWKRVEVPHHAGQVGALQVFGVQNDVIDVEFIHQSSDDPVSALDSEITEDGLYPIYPLSGGSYRVNKDGSSDQPTVRIIVG